MARNPPKVLPLYATRSECGVLKVPIHDRALSYGSVLAYELPYQPIVLTSASGKSSCQKLIGPALFLIRQTHQTTNQNAPLCGLDIHL